MRVYSIRLDCQIQAATAWHIQSRAPLTSTPVRCYNGGQTNTARRHRAHEDGHKAARALFCISDLGG